MRLYHHRCGPCPLLAPPARLRPTAIPALHGQREHRRRAHEQLVALGDAFGRGDWQQRGDLAGGLHAGRLACQPQA
eukprot:6360850-Prymnesium_polylepis.1